MAVKVAMNTTATAAWPKQAEAAEMLGVSESTLLRSRLKLPSVPAGGKEKRYPPAAVMAAAIHFQRRPVRQVAADLNALARRKSPDVADIVAREVNDFLAVQARAERESAEDLLQELEASLPRALYRGIEATYRGKPRAGGRSTKAEERMVPADKSRRASNSPA